MVVDGLLVDVCVVFRVVLVCEPVDLLVIGGWVVEGVVTRLVVRLCVLAVFVALVVILVVGVVQNPQCLGHFHL